MCPACAPRVGVEAQQVRHAARGDDDGPDAVLLDRDGVMFAHKAGVIPTMVFEGICLTSGCWYYEVTLHKEGNLHRSKIGWADPLLTVKSHENIGVGDDKHSVRS